MSAPSGVTGEESASGGGGGRSRSDSRPRIIRLEPRGTLGRRGPRLPLCLQWNAKISLMWLFSHESTDKTGKCDCNGHNTLLGGLFCPLHKKKKENEIYTQTYVGNDRSVDRVLLLKILPPPLVGALWCPRSLTGPRRKCLKNTLPSSPRTFKIPAICYVQIWAPP